jgi:phage replication-related protein YjqB (UPF0714/DUF867 family)
MDKFDSFTHLARHKKEGADYSITAREVQGSTVAIVAPHGGMETNAAEMAEAIAGDNHNLYIFRSLEGSGGFEEMHITSVHFDEPRCLDLVAKTDVTLTIHASRFREEAVYLSGMDKKLQSKLSEAFNKAGVRAVTEGHPYQSGTLPENICNRNRQKQGVQLEFSQGIRDNPVLREKCVGIVRDALKIKR